MNFFIEHVGKATMKNYKYFVKKNLSIDDSYANYEHMVTSPNNHTSKL